MNQKPDVGSLVYWVEIDQSLIIGNGQVKITLVNTTKGKARLRLQVNKTLQPIATTRAASEVHC
jgi:hypothetical protein